MKKIITKMTLLILAGCLAISGCKKESNTTPPAAPAGPAAVLSALTTTSVTGITGTTAQSGGNITSDGGNTITARGVCWSSTPSPTTANSKTTAGSGAGVYSSAITGLTANTTYYVRAYATNSTGIAYGNELSFTTTATTLTQNVYVAGYENGAPKMWKNGVSTWVDGNTNGAASSIFVSGTDVYVAGSVGSLGMIWKNPTNGNSGNSLRNSYGASSVYVSGTDVYVAGWGPDGSTTVSNPKIWKNGVETTLRSDVYPAYANSVFVSGTDVYVAGVVRTQNGNLYARIWKNGVATTLLDGRSATSVYVSGTDVYVAGSMYGSGATIWKNGVATSLTGGDVANSVYVLGTDVYVAGYQYNGQNTVAKVWKNGVATSLTGGDVANSVYVLGTDVYVAGSQFNGTNEVAKVWKNGVATVLNNGSGDAAALSIFVK